MHFGALQNFHGPVFPILLFRPLLGVPEGHVTLQDTGTPDNRRN